MYSIMYILYSSLIIFLVYHIYIHIYPYISIYIHIQIWKYCTHAIYIFYTLFFNVLQEPWIWKTLLVMLVSWINIIIIHSFKVNGSGYEIKILCLDPGLFVERRCALSLPSPASDLHTYIWSKTPCMSKKWIAKDGWNWRPVPLSSFCLRDWHEATWTELKVLIKLKPLHELITSLLIWSVWKR